MNVFKIRMYIGWTLLIAGCLIAWVPIIGGILSIVIGCVFLVPGILVIPSSDMKFGGRTVIKRKHTITMTRNDDDTYEQRKSKEL